MQIEARKGNHGLDYTYSDLPFMMKVTQSTYPENDLRLALM
jgi:hypothetical protein